MAAVTAFLLFSSLLVSRVQASSTPTMALTSSTKATMVVTVTDPGTDPTDNSVLTTNPSAGVTITFAAGGVTNEFQFTLTGLTSGTCYTVTYDPPDAAENVEQAFCTELDLSASSHTLVQFTLEVASGSGTVTSFTAKYDDKTGTEVTKTSSSNTGVIDTLNAGTKYTVNVDTAAVTLNAGAVAKPGSHTWTGTGIFCSKPAPAASVAVDSTVDPTQRSLTLTVAANSDTNANTDTTNKIAISCNGDSETEQSCSTDSCGITGLTKPGCIYTFTVRKSCETTGSAAVDSTTVTTDACTKPAPVASVTLDGTVAPTQTSLTLTVAANADANANPDSTTNITISCGGVAESEQTCSGTSCALTGLAKPGCIYAFAVRKSCKASAEATAIDSTTVTENACTKPAPVASVTTDTSVAPTQTSLTLTVAPNADSDANSDSTTKIAISCNGNSESEKTCGSGTCAITGLNVPGCNYLFTVRKSCKANAEATDVDSTTVTANSCTKPLPVTTVAVKANSETSSGITLTVTTTTTSGANPSSDIAITPICDGNAETEQTPDCTGDTEVKDCPLVGLAVAGCPYTFMVRTLCGKDSTYEAYSDSVNLTNTCITPGSVAVPGTAGQETSFTATTTSVTITGVNTLADTSHKFDDFFLKYNGGANTKTVTSLTAATCYDMTIVLTCGALESETTGHKFCTKHTVAVASQATDSVTVSWPFDSTKLDGLTVTEYSSSTDGRAAEVQTSSIGSSFTTSSLLSDPGTVHTISTTVKFSQEQVNTADAVEFCLKPDAVTVDADQTTVDTSSFTIAGFGVESGSSAGYEGTLTRNENTQTVCTVPSGNDAQFSGASAAYTNLTPGCVYNLAVNAYCEIQSTIAAQGASRNYKQCTEPDNLVTSNTDPGLSADPTTSITVSNVKVANGIGQASIGITSTQPGCDAVYANIDSVTATGYVSKTVNGLTQGCPYNIRVRPYCSSEGTVYNASSFYDTDICTKPDVVSSMTFTDPTTTDVITVATAPATSGSSTNMLVRASCSETNSVSKSGDSAVTATALPFSVDGLSPGCEYTVGVTLRCRAGDAGAYTSGTEFTDTQCTKPATPALGAVSAIDMTTLSYAGISVASGYAKKFSVSIKCNLTNTPTAVVFSSLSITDGTQAIAVTGLVSGCKHEVTLKSYCLTNDAADAQQMSEDEIVYQCSKPTAVTASTDINPTFIDLTSIASPANTYKTSYSVQVESTQDTRAGFPRTFDGNTEDSFNVTDLVPATLYTIKVTAMCDDVAADALEYTNIVSRPEPLNFTISEETSSSCKISVTEPSYGNTAYYAYVFSIKEGSTAADFGSFKTFSAEEIFSTLKSSTDYTIYAKSQYTHPDAPGGAIESEVSSLTCRTGPVNFVSASFEYIQAISLVIKAQYPTSQDLASPDQLQIIAAYQQVGSGDTGANLGTELSYAGDTACVSTDNSANCATRVFTRQVTGLVPGTTYTLSVYAQYGSTRSNSPVSVAMADGETTYGCWNSSEANAPQVCFLPTGSQDAAANYRCAGGYAVGLVSGVCEDTCTAGGLRPNNNDRTNCIAKCGYMTDYCSCTDMFDSTTCTCDAGTLFSPSTAFCTRNCDSGQGHCRDDGALCTSSDNSDCYCEANYFITVSGNNVACTATTGAFCDPLRGDTVDVLYTGNADDNPCNCSSPSDTSSCACINGYLPKHDDNTRCVDIICDPDMAALDGTTGVCKCTDSADLQTCNCRAGYRSNSNAQCTHFCSVDTDDANCLVTTLDSVKCFGNKRDNETCSCRPGYAVQSSSDGQTSSCVSGCFSTVVTHYGITVAQLYDDDDKCTCLDDMDVSTCGCLAGYAMLNGVCSKTCTRSVGANCITNVADKTACSASDSSCFCAPGYQASAGANSIDCVALSAAYCNPSLSQIGCLCTDFHNITTCTCFQGYSQHPNNTNMCLRSVNITIEVVYDVPYDSRLDDPNSDTFKETATVYETNQLRVLRADDPSVIKVTVISFAPGSTKVTSKVERGDSRRYNR